MLQFLMHQKVLEMISDRLSKRNRAVFVTGSVARGDQTQSSDLDILVVTKKGRSFKEETIEGILVEIKKDSLQGFKNKMLKDPMNIYQWLDAVAVYDPENILPPLKEMAEEIFSNYKPISFPSKWLKSSKKKIESAKATNNKSFLSFHTSNSLWKVVEGIYLVNSIPVPPTTTAFKRIKALKKLPQNFDVLWENALNGDLDERAHTLLLFIEFIQKAHGV